MEFDVEAALAQIEVAKQSLTDCVKDRPDLFNDPLCKSCGSVFTPVYLVDDTTKELGLETSEAHCFTCLQNKLDRKIVIEDIRPCPANEMIFFGYSLVK